MPRERQRRREPADAAADDQNIVIHPGPPILLLI
jgi:hypothetical protein